MRIRSTTEEDLDVFVDTVHAAFGRHPETPVDGEGSGGRRSRWTVACSP